MSIRSTFPIIDFEASSLHGFPIEFGWAIADIEAGTIEADSFLIRPTQDWIEHWEWDPVSEEMHGISLDQLEREGVDVMDAVARISKMFGRAALFSDGAEHDEAWMHMLFEAGNTKRLPAPAFITDTMQIFQSISFDPDRLQDEYIAMEETSALHRAKEDALAWAHIVQRVAGKEQPRPR